MEEIARRYACAFAEHLLDVLNFITGIYRFTLLSGYKSNRFSWLKKQGKSSWESIC